MNPKKPPVVVRPETPPVGVDQKAEDEAMAFSSPDYVEFAKQKSMADQIGQRSSLEKFVFSLLKLLLVVLFLVVASAVTILAWHMLSPSNWRWLSGEEVNEVRNFLFSGTFGAVISGLASFVFGRSRDNS